MIGPVCLSACLLVCLLACLSVCPSVGLLSVVVLVTGFASHFVWGSLGPLWDLLGRLGGLFEQSVLTPDRLAGLAVSFHLVLFSFTAPRENFIVVEPGALPVQVVAPGALSMQIILVHMLPSLSVCLLD